MRVLGIETSCDETGVALYDSERGLLADALYSQVAMHAEYGGVVPELASRDHILKLVPLIRQVLAEAGCQAVDIDAIAYTAGPGLIGALMTGASLANALAMAWQVPVLGVHHMEGHLLAPMLEESPPSFPFLALLVSGGHTQLMQVKALGDYQLLGESLDDAAGEAFDKAAKMLGLAYPGGPLVAARAEQGTPGRFRFPRPMTDRPGLDMSFSGQDISDIALAFQDAVIDTLAIKCRRALQQTGMKTLVIAGGVSANKMLRQKLAEIAAKQDATLFYARPEFCTDNGAMIAYAGCQRLLAGQRGDLIIQARPRWPMVELKGLN